MGAKFKVEDGCRYARETSIIHPYSPNVHIFAVSLGEIQFSYFIKCENYHMKGNGFIENLSVRGI